MEEWGNLASLVMEALGAFVKMAIAGNFGMRKKEKLGLIVYI